ncbi:hypothetical protein [Paraflavitalea speifideaquila]|uniref:hypothetical protein n=1 Tax=Paraflavitalea speifideaquila TaxID=3076558 RepID=UPI0028EC00E8|nr:hypothetical protein [Paraflavitalea speifideiaquila]
MLNEAQIKDLLDKALAGTASQEELRVLAGALKDDPEYTVTDQVTAFEHATGYAYPPQPGTDRPNGR